MTDPETDLYDCGHTVRARGCGGCDPAAIEFVITDSGTTRPFDPTLDLAIPTNPDACWCGNAGCAESEETLHCTDDCPDDCQTDHAGER